MGCWVPPSPRQLLHAPRRHGFPRVLWPLYTPCPASEPHAQSPPGLQAPDSLGPVTGAGGTASPPAAGNLRSRRSIRQLEEKGKGAGVWKGRGPAPAATLRGRRGPSARSGPPLRRRPRPVRLHGGPLFSPVSSSLSGPCPAPLFPGSFWLSLAGVRDRRGAAGPRYARSGPARAFPRPRSTPRTQGASARASWPRPRTLRRTAPREVEGPGPAGLYFRGGGFGGGGGPRGPSVSAWPAGERDRGPSRGTFRPSRVRSGRAAGIPGPSAPSPSPLPRPLALPRPHRVRAPPLGALPLRFPCLVRIHWNTSDVFGIFPFLFHLALFYLLV